jgi:hypothetical protein
MPMTRTLALSVTLILAAALDMATSNFASAEVRWCRIVMGKCFAMDKPGWAEIPMKPNAGFGLTGTAAQGSAPAARPIGAGNNARAFGRSRHANSASRCFTYNGRAYC